MKNAESFEFRPIGYVQTLFKDKFGIPRQPGLVAQAKGVIKLTDSADIKTALRTLNQFSHLWIVFVFHEHGGKNWKPSIRPPRLGGKAKVGVLASRSPHRPNPIGISAVSIEKIDAQAPGGPEITVGGVDLLDGTPVLDIKPYIPYADSIPHAHPGWASEAIEKHPVFFTDTAQTKLQDFSSDENLEKLIVEVLELDPRPAFQKRKHPRSSPEAWQKKYGFAVLDFDVKYEIRDDGFWVLNIEKLQK